MCIQETVSRVRIPSSPPYSIRQRPPECLGFRGFLVSGLGHASGGGAGPGVSGAQRIADSLRDYPDDWHWHTKGYELKHSPSGFMLWVADKDHRLAEVSASGGKSESSATHGQVRATRLRRPTDLGPERYQSRHASTAALKKFCMFGVLRNERRICSGIHQNAGGPQPGGLRNVMSAIVRVLAADSIDNSTKQSWQKLIDSGASTGDSGRSCLPGTCLFTTAACARSSTGN